MSDSIIKAEPGQVWREKPRMYEKRTVRIEAIEDGKAVVTTLTETTGEKAAPRKPTRVSLDDKGRLKNYVYVSGAPARVWEVPAEPGPEVTALHSVRWGTFVRSPHHAGLWCGTDDSGEPLGASMRFLDLLQYGPLTDATPAEPDAR